MARPSRTPRSKRILGYSVARRPIAAFVFPASIADRHRRPRHRLERPIVVLGGFHGDEPKSVFLALKLADELSTASKGERAGQFDWVVIPIVNPDGYARRTRRNANGVDLNRNFPTANWILGNPRSRMFGGPIAASEPETRTVIRAIDRFNPCCIVTIHSIDKGRFCNNYDGPARTIARAMSAANGYPVTRHIGYPTPGSFGNWVGVERAIPTITLELPSHHSSARCWTDNREALLRLPLHVTGL